MKELLLIGGGHSHVEVLRRWARRPADGVRVTLVSPDRFTPYSGMLPGLVAGHYAHRDAHIDLERLSAFAAARHLADRVVTLDPVGRVARTAAGQAVAFDVASLDIGSTPATYGIHGLEHAVGVKPVDGLLAWLDRLAENVRSGTVRRIAVIGGGAAGIEVLLAMQYRLQREAPSSMPEFACVTDTPAVLSSHNERVRRIFRRVLDEREVAVHTGSPVVALTADAVVTAAAGARVAADATVLATGAAPAAWPGEAGLAVDSRGFVRVNERLQSVSHPGIFAAGDVASIDAHPRPKSGVFAVRQGPPLEANLRRALAGEPLEPFVPQETALALISTGDRYAVASRGGWALEGAWVWRWKDWIDRRFMRRYDV